MNTTRRKLPLISTTLSVNYTMKLLPARPLRALHVPTLFHTCLLVLLTATLPNTRSHENITITAQMRVHMKFGSDFRSEFLRTLRERRTPQVPLKVEIAKPVANAWYQKNSPSSTDEEIMKSCPKKDIPKFKDLLKEENLYLNIEKGDQGKLPLLILSLKESDKEIKKPAVVFLHGTNKYKEFLRPLLEAYASRGYIAISVDSRYHGERAKSATSYHDALISAWKTGHTMPFIYDTVWDLIKLADYLTQRKDIDPSRIGITGISLGGMHAWFAGAADTRYAVVAPLIGVQGFRWTIDNDKWHDRVDSIKPVFEAARHDLRKSVIDKDVVENVWDRIAPGLASHFDAPYSIPAIAPRPLLIINGAEDPRCHLAGLENVMLQTSRVYEVFHCRDDFKFEAEPEIAHKISKFQVKESSDWFDRFLKPQQLEPKL